MGFAISLFLTASVERDRRQLEHQLVETIGGRAHSEDRIIK